MRPINAGSQRPTRPVTAEQAWRATTERARQCVLFFDFDGTLAPMNDDPTAVQPAPKVLDAINALTNLVQRVAIVSARPVEFLRDRFAVLAGVDLYGLYGLEHSHSGGATVNSSARIVCFVGWMWWAYSARNRARMAQAALLPLTTGDDA